MGATWHTHRVGRRCCGAGDFFIYWQGDAGKPAGLPYQFCAGVKSRPS